MSRLAPESTQPPTQRVQRPRRKVDLSPTIGQLRLHSRMCPHGAHRDNLISTFSAYLIRCDWQSAEVSKGTGSSDQHSASYDEGPGFKSRNSSWLSRLRLPLPQVLQVNCGALPKIGPRSLAAVPLEIHTSLILSYYAANR